VKSDERKALETSSLQIANPKAVRFWPKKRAILQKIGGPTEIISHFFSCFHGFWDFFRRKLLIDSHQRRSNPSKKNHA
jgi:hypothetical protein